MKITIEPTKDNAFVHGIPTRIWNGLTESGIHCRVHVTAIEIDEHNRLTHLNTPDSDIRALLDGAPLL
jgi:hypothetical protein